jgi:WD40 repeat protein
MTEPVDVDAACDVDLKEHALRLEEEWRHGRAPNVWDFLAAAGPLHSRELADVLLVDQRERWQCGQRIPTESYLLHQSKLVTERESVFDLIYGEALLRRERGESPSLEEYLLRFPQYADWLQRQFAVDQALAQELFSDRCEEKPPVPTTQDSPGDPAAEGLPVGQRQTPPLEAGTEPENALPPAAAPLPAISGYELISELGRGGMGVVYKARQIGLKRIVALKMILAGPHAGPGELARFRTEAEAVARQQHPNIVQIYQVGEQGGIPFFSLEFIEGGSLAQKLSGTPMQARPAAELLETVAWAMHAAHQRGIIHRDLKPANVLLTTEGLPKITDFGLAKRLDDSAGQTGSGAIMGTPSYMAPEQANAKREEIGPVTDVYALGSILYEMLTGRPPFKAATPFDTIQQVLSEEPVPPSRLQPKVPRDLETICLKCLEKEARKRYGSAADLADDVHRFLAGEAIQARPTPWWERAAKWAKRRPERAILWGLAAAAISLLVGTLVFYALSKAKQQEEEVESARSTLLGTVGEVELERAERLRTERRGAEVETRALLERARQRQRQPTYGQHTETRALLQKVAALRSRLEAGPVADQLDLEARSAFAASLGVPELREVETARLPEDFPHIWRVALHPGGEALAIGTPEKPVRWVRGQPLRLPKNQDPKQERPRLWYSPDGQYLLFAPATGGLQVWDANATRRVRELDQAATSPILAVGFNRQRKTLWACRQDAQLRSWSLTDFREKGPWQRIDFSETLQAAAFNGDATLLAVGNDKGRVLLLQAGGKPLRDLPKSRPHVGALGWSPDSSLVAIGTPDGNVEVRQAEGLHLYSLSAFGAEVSTVLFHPEGRWLLAGDRRGNMKMWDVTTEAQVLTGPMAPLGFARDGRRLAGSSSNHVGFWDLIVPQVVRQLSGHRANIVQTSWCRDGKHLASIDSSFVVRVWDVNRGVCLNEFRMPPGRWDASNVGVALSEDARHLAYADGREALILAVSTEEELLGRWPLPEAFGNRLACLGGSKFRLVREEQAKGQGEAYELQAGKDAPKILATVRPPLPGESGFCSNELTADGRYYYWYGPRKPLQRRLEVREVATGRLVRCVEEKPNQPEMQGGLSPDGRYLFQGMDKGALRYDLHRSDAPAQMRAMPADVSPAAGLWAFDNHADIPGDNLLSLWPAHGDRPWLTFGNDDLSSPQAVRFSPDGRYLVWGSQSGVLTVVDLPALKHDVGEFEKSLPAR